jgi:VanZ family protein
MRQVLEFVYATIGRQTAISIFGISFIFFFLIIFAWVIRLPLEPKRRKLVFLIVFVLGLSLSWHLKIVAERIHILEYGFLGYMVARDLLKNYIRFKTLGVVILIVAVFAFFDEGFQYILPNRCWDLRDIAFNLSGGIWGLSLFLVKRTS